MGKNYQQDPNLVKDVAKNTERIEKAYLAKQSKKRQNKTEKEELSQRWVAPLLLVITLLLGFLVSIIFN
jgi:lipopolysaccharide export LptBFGC system permease protein LptF